MTKSFRIKRKTFTIPEGHFTGQKDVEELPSLLHNIGKGVTWGSGIGALVGGVHGHFSDDSSTFGGMLDGSIQGTKVGLASGIMLKFFQNYIHKPMKSIKFQEIDRGIRRQFGMYRVAGLSVGESIGHRATMDEKFSFNDRNVSDYKINIAIQNDKVTMYTFGMSNSEIDTCSKVLDYYAQKYFGVNYNSKLINHAVNSYAIDITFTNYNVIVNFIMELSQELQTKINLMNENAIVLNRLKEAAENTTNNTDQKNFSVPELSKSDVARILGRTGQYIIDESRKGYNWKKAGAAAAIGLIKSTIEATASIELTKLGLKKSRSEYGNSFLEKELKKLHYAENVNYTVGDKSALNNITLINGRFVVTVPNTKKTNSVIEKIDSNFYNPMRLKINRTDTGDTIVYSYVLDSIKEFELLINKLFLTKIKFNIFV